MEPQEAMGPYLGTGEGAFGLALFTVLNILSFMILIDREPSRITSRVNGSENSSAPYPFGRDVACDNASSSQGLYVVPEDVCFPAGPLLESIVPVVLLVIFFIFISHITGSTRIGSNWRSSVPVLVAYVSLGFFDVTFVDWLGINQAQTSPVGPIIGLVFVVHVLLVALPFWVYGLPLLPRWMNYTSLSRKRTREGLSHFIDANWRRARILTTLVLTGVVGTTLPFVFSRADPNVPFLAGIVGSVAVGPLAIVWFLMRRIREAEKELQPPP